MKFLVRADVDWVMGYLRYGHLEGVVEAESEEELKEKMKSRDFRHNLDLVVDNYSVEDYGDIGEYEYSKL